MSKIRIAARIDVKNEHVIKGIHLEGLRKIGDPNIIAKKYYENGIDEIIFMDAVAAYYDRNSLSHIIEKACRNVFVPITVGGGIRTINDIHTALRSGADKVAINTRAIKDPSFIKRASKIFGSQCIVISVEAKRNSDNTWQAYFDNGREPSGKNAIEWVKEAEELGAGEIMITSIDAEGTKKGFDIDLNHAVAEVSSLPIIASGGAGKIEHIDSLLSKADIDAVALASLLHYEIAEINEVKEKLLQHGYKVRF